VSQASGQLRRSLNLAQAIALAITLVVGAGASILPGLAYTQVGSVAVYAWVADAVLVIPLLVIFSYLAGIMPSADGVTGFINVGLSSWMGFASKALMLSTFVIAPPAIAVTRGRYFAEAVGGSLSEVIGVCILFGVAFSVNLAGVRISGTVQQVLALIVTAALASIAIAAMALGDHQVGTGIAPLSRGLDGAPAMGMVFFAFGGWELLSFMAEELKNPKRDFPLAAAISFLVVVSL
jgi:amino acid efflux transporter